MLNQWHGKGVGQQLYEYAVQFAQTHQTDYLWLGVWEYNHKALNFYHKNGFIPFDRHIFKLGNDEQTDIMMKLEFLIERTNPFDKLAELVAQLSNIYANVAKQHQLTLNELNFLYSIGRYGAASPSTIGNKWSLPKQTVTSVCK